MMLVRVVSFEQTYSVHDTLPDLFVKPTGKISVILAGLCYGEIGMYRHEVFLSERALWAGFISALRHFVRGQPTEACWSHLYLDVQGCPCSRPEDISQHQLPSRAFTGACQGIARKKVKHHLSHIHSALQFLFFSAFLVS